MALQVNSFRFGKVPRLISKLFSTSTKTSGYVQAERFSLNIETSTSYLYKGDVLVVPFFKPKVEKKDDTVALISALKDSIPKSLSPVVISAISEILDEGNFKADVSSKQVTRVFGGGDAKYIAIVGLGPDKGKGVGQDIEVSVAYKLGKTVGAVTKELKSKSAGLVLPSSMGNAGMSQFFIGFHDTVYSDKRFRSEDKSQKPFETTTLSLLGCSDAIAKDAALTLTLSKKIVAGVEFAKDLVMAPPNSKTPVAIAEEARKIAQENGLQITVLAEKECKELGMGGYLGVQQGSMFPPQFIHMTYKPEGVSESADGGVLKVALIGKGLTFDSGGYNLKAGAGSMIEMMKFDMGGCAAVLGCAKAIGALKPKVCIRMKVGCTHSNNSERLLIFIYTFIHLTIL